ncbi:MULTISPECIES: septation protein SepH [Rhodococcus]|uniref:Septation protein SepH n=1 Tax=Rhodococcus oxybenzonivorans TaxID=1990687 RepID=A0AAE5A7P2_9NOCA|nr:MULTISPECIES: septation protein SepH [Rhodococcus]MDV7240754.1 septation protein SepH [Rhodococcus oxybenzonivorans]MDV7266348.1 septation protein SepH [Rhodococcus oxybenzonivorans]MDV7273027.1 septation protein SepH [Rhodococcus oxybenzonivorans]MDV7333235.1 septation protein SepH [Rhodococcus oxybenzonivorans]MDV7342401.1 septation protein SepH [Rhodococcus oxybenzonivorans]
MRELRVIGLEPDGSHVVCADAATGEKFRLPADDKLRAASRGDIARLGQIEIEMDSQLRPREIQARIRAGASVEQVADEAGIPLSKVERFAYPVLLERSRAAEMAQGGHPVRDNGPAVPTLAEIVTQAFRARGHNIDDATWDAWRDEDNHWVAQLQWQAGRTTNAAHWRYQPDAHGGTIVALDDTAFDLIDPDFGRPLRGLAPVASDEPEQLEFVDYPAESTSPAAEPERIVEAETDVPEPVDEDTEPEPTAPKVAPHQTSNRDKRGKPSLPSWDDVLLGVRSSGR